MDSLLSGGIRDIISLNTNRAALQALQAASDASASLARTERRVSTGLAVSGTKDDSARFAVAQQLRGDLGAWQSIASSLNRGRSVVDVAATTAEQIGDMVNLLSAKAMQYADRGIDPGSRLALRADMEALIGQIDTAANGASFGNTNLLTSKADALLATETSTYTAPAGSRPFPGVDVRMAALPPGASLTIQQQPSLSAAASPLTPASFSSILGWTIGAVEQTRTFNAGPVAGQVNLLVNAGALPDSVEIWQNGVRVAASGRPAASGADAVDEALPFQNDELLSFDYDPAKGQAIELRFKAQSSSSGWEVKQFTLSNPANPATQPTIASTAKITLSAEAGSGVPLSDPEAYASALGLQPIGSAATYELDAGSISGRIDLAFDAFSGADRLDIYQNGKRVAATGRAYASGGGAVAEGIATAGRQMISFDYDASAGPLTFRFNEGGGSGSAWAVTSMALRPSAGPLPALPSKILSTGSAVGMAPKSFDVPADLTGGELTLTSRDLSAAGLGLDPMDWASPGAVEAAAKSAASLVRGAVSYFGARARDLESRIAHVSRMEDTFSSGIGAIVDADMAKESARLEAEQVRQQLMLQSLSIANAAPEMLMSLFRG